MLEGLKFKSGLPAGPREIDMIELARHRHAMEAALPPSTDEESVRIRMALLEKVCPRHLLLPSLFSLLPQPYPYHVEHAERA